MLLYIYDIIRYSKLEVFMTAFDRVVVGNVWKAVTPFGDAPSVILEFRILERGLMQVSEDPTDTKFLGARVSVLSIDGNAIPAENPVILYFSAAFFDKATPVL